MLIQNAYHFSSWHERVPGSKLQMNTNPHQLEIYWNLNDFKKPHSITKNSKICFFFYFGDINSCKMISVKETFKS